MKVISTEKLPIKMWLEDIEDGAMDQIINLANLPFAFKHIAIMPDSHQGYGMPIGGVLATKGVIVPNAVGVDIGCGMCALKTSLTELETGTLKKIMSRIRMAVPVGFAHHEKAQENFLPEISDNFSANTYPVVSKEEEKAKYQIGTLGGGNHFIEIQKGSDGNIWIMIHSGSRNLGKQVADHYNLLAKDLNTKWHSSVPKELDLAFLPMDSDVGKAYIREMNYCIEFALANRKLMMNRIKESFMIGLEDDGSEVEEMNNVFPYEMINIAHNYAKMEHHFGSNVMVHRKGATLATKETTGIIPGSQGTKSYIVNGKGNPQSFNSCSHGAGRKMGRKEAERRLNLDEEVNRLDALGVIHAIRRLKDLDEAPGAYKDIDIVMKNQEDLVDIVVELSPLGVIKG